MANALLLLLAVSIAGSAPLAPPAPGDDWLRTELYFGRAIPASAGGGEVTDEAWEAFVAEEITPRFPDGLTVAPVAGQWRDAASGRVVRERTSVVVVYHPPGRDAGERVEAVRRAYQRRFAQDSVMRVTSRARVAF